MPHIYGARRPRAGAGLVALSAAILATTLVSRAYQAPGGAARLVPMTASTLLRDPAAHLGENVSLMAAVETVLSKTAFTVDQDHTKSTGKELLVLAPTLSAEPERNAYFTIQGEVMRFDPAEIEKKARSYKLDLTPEQIAKYKGQPMVLATVVVTPGLVDLAKRVAAPMTPAELAFRQFMLTINPANTALRAALDKPDAAAAKEQIAALKTSFAGVETYFKTHGPIEAAKIATDAVAFVTSMETSLQAAKLEEVKTSSAGLTQLCAACHGQFRERFDDGSFRIKSGG